MRKSTPPILSYKGVDIYCVGNCSYWFSWKQFRPPSGYKDDGDVFDIRKVFPPKDRWTMILPDKKIEHLKAYIDLCFCKGLTPWAPFQTPGDKKIDRSGIKILDTDESVIILSLDNLAWRELHRKSSAIKKLVDAFNTSIRNGARPENHDILCFSPPNELLVGRKRIVDLQAITCQNISESEVVRLLISGLSHDSGVIHANTGSGITNR